MDMLENKKVRDKINELDTLPEAYHPNMASKWSLLEAGLDGNDNDNRKVIAWKRIAVAAVLLMMVGSAFVLFDYKETSPVSEKSSVIKPAIKLTELQPVHKMKEKAKPVKKVNRKKPLSAPVKPVKEEVRIAVIPVKDSIVQPLAPAKETAMQAANSPKAKKLRFIELDFNDNISVYKPIEPVPAPPQARFRINIPSGQDGKPREPIISFSF
jgi:hypothetical protein